jgi:hypothetical protein
MELEEPKTEAEKIPIMPVPFNLNYSIKWWTSMSINGIEGKKGSFNLNLYMAIVNRELYNHQDYVEEEPIPQSRWLRFKNNIINMFSYDEF